MLIKNLFLILMAASVLIMSTLFVLHYSPHEKLIGKNTSDTPDGYIKNAVITEINSLGQAKYTLKTKEAIHYPEQDLYIMLEPDLVTYNESGVDWTINANHGQTRDNHDEIELWDNVIATQPGEEELTITTSYIQYWPNNAYAETDQLVTLAQPGTYLEGIGLRAYLDTQRVELLSNIKQTQQPKHSVQAIG